MYRRKPERVLSSVLEGYGWPFALVASAMNVGDNHVLKSLGSDTSNKLSGHFS